MNETIIPEYDHCIEQLLHLRCSVCGGWWTIGDGDSTRVYCCPYCSQRLAPAQYPDDPPRPRRASNEVPL